jgi:hypothetical protein
MIAAESMSQFAGWRRELLSALASASGVALAPCATIRTGGQAATAPGKVEKEKEEDENEAEVTPGEDLMQEHGMLERILLICDVAKVSKWEAALGIGDPARFTP